MSELNEKKSITAMVMKVSLDRAAAAEIQKLQEVTEAIRAYLRRNRRSAWSR